MTALRIQSTAPTAMSASKKPFLVTSSNPTERAAVNCGAVALTVVLSPKQREQVWDTLRYDLRPFSDSESYHDGIRFLAELGLTPATARQAMEAR